MEAIHSLHKMHSKEDQNSLTLMQVLESGGSALSKEVSNGSGKSEFKTEETAVEIDSVEQRLVLEDKSVVEFQMALRMVNGMKLDAASQSEVTKSFLKLQEKTISQSQELKSTQLLAQEMAVEVLHHQP
jgi:hypothetical protein